MANTVEGGFLEAIRDDPEDDAVRLIYADWLEEHDQTDRAELIRLQCTIPTMPKSDTRRRELLIRENALLKRHGKEWTCGLYPGMATGHAFVESNPTRFDAPELYFRRGFVETISGVLDLAELLKAELPLLHIAQNLELRCPPIDDLVELLRESRLSYLRFLEVTGSTDAHIDAIVQMVLPRLNTLFLSGDISDQSLVQIGQSIPTLSSLQEILVHSPLLTEEGYVALLQSALSKQLTRIVINGRIMKEVQFSESVPGPEPDPIPMPAPLPTESISKWQRFLQWIGIGQ